MSVEETNKIDRTAWDKNKTHVWLVISDHLDWEVEEGEHLLLLQDKLNSYLDFIESGKLVETLPWANGLPVTIRIYGKFPLSAEAARFLELVRQKLETIDLSVEFKLFNPD
jgi:hypothetical protein